MPTPDTTTQLRFLGAAGRAESVSSQPVQRLHMQCRICDHQVNRFTLQRLNQQPLRHTRCRKRLRRSHECLGKPEHKAKITVKNYDPIRCLLAPLRMSAECGNCDSRL